MTDEVDPPATPPFHAPRDEVGTLLDTLRLAVVVLDTTGRVVMWGPHAEEMLGWAGEHVVGRRLESLLAREDDDGDARADGAEVVGGILATLLRHGRWNGALPLRHRDAHTVRVEVRAALLVDGDGRPFVLASLAETGAVRTVEQDLAVLDSLFQSSPLGIGVFDTDLRHVRVNEALARMNGLPVGAHLGRTIEEVLHAPGLDAPLAREVTALQRHVLRTGLPVVDLTLPAPDGGGYRSFSCNRLEDGGGRVLGMSCTVMDVTERLESSAKVERARWRLDLLNDVGRRISDLLDMPRVAREMAHALVPRFCDYSGVSLLPDVLGGGDLPRAPYPRPPTLVQMGAAAAVVRGPEVERLLGEGRPMAFSEGSVFETVLLTGVPRIVNTPEQILAVTYPRDPRVRIAMDLGIHSVMVLPLRARGVVLGLVVLGRAAGREAFDRDDLALATELADRAGVSLDNARLYARERAAALTLQRSLLPQRVPVPPGVRLAYRYVPASGGTEVGGDWFDVIPLAGGRVALVVGDVMGHGLRAAATMGRLRTAVRTLSQLDLSPCTLLRHVNGLADDLAHGPDEALMATCLYAVYDPAVRRVCAARAGHVPPLLLVPAAGSGPPREVRRLDLPAGAPLGVEGVPFESVEVGVPDGAVLVLYTDGLVEKRGEDITLGIERLAALLRQGPRDLEACCDAALTGLTPGQAPDDVALLMAGLGGLPEDAHVSWTFPAEPGTAARARALVRRVLAEWDLAFLEDTAVLLVSELVTNSLRHARGPIGLRLVRGHALLVEVSDPLPDPPRERHVEMTDESGRGMQLVAGASRRWGTRHSQDGKVVWFELALPGS